MRIMDILKIYYNFTAWKLCSSINLLLLRLFIEVSLVPKTAYICRKVLTSYLIKWVKVTEYKTELFIIMKQKYIALLISGVESLKIKIRHKIGISSKQHWQKLLKISENIIILYRTVNNTNNTLCKITNISPWVLICEKHALSINWYTSELPHVGFPT